jgi:hypothetical protein
VTFPDYDALVVESKPDIAGDEVRLSLLRRGAELEHDRIVALLDTYDITELQGGVIMLRPKPVEKQAGVEHATGSLAGYYRKGCRCDGCSRVAREWRDERAESLDDAEKALQRERKTALQRERRLMRKMGAL